MRFLSLIVSIIVAVLSIVVFRDQVIDFATASIERITKQLNDILRDTTVLNYSTSDTESSKTKTGSPFYSPTEQLFATDMSIPRNIRKVFLAVEQAEGAGARVRRSIGTPQLRNFSPFLMLDHFSIKPGAGFPDHPHRGQET
jgi:uncharacterized protein (UPF0147 family)